jgi:YD repeat-containing protein
MQFRPFVLALLGFQALSALSGQEEAGKPVLFPLSPLLDAAVSGESPWRPDWPAAMPPDGFVLATGRAEALTLVLPAGYLDGVPGGAAENGADSGAAENGGGEAALEYRLVRDAEGRFLAFPLPLNGAFCQAEAAYDGEGRAVKIALNNPAAGAAAADLWDSQNPWEYEFLEYREGKPAVARINHGGAWSFAAPEYRETQTGETWYDAEGRALGFFALKYRLEGGTRRLVSTDSRSDGGGTLLAYRYNSAGRISGISAPEGEYTALYNAAALPRYWERPEGSYTLQWDQAGFLVRLTGVLEPTGAETDPQQIDIRYEYTLDERGNWIERRETSFIRRFGRLVPESEAAIRRIIRYGGD